MNDIENWANQLASWFGPNPYLQASVIAAASIAIAKLVAIFLSRVCQRLTARSKTQIDDHVIALIQRPIFITVLCLGLAIALSRLPQSEAIEMRALVLLRTLVLFVWSQFAFRISRVLISTLRTSGSPLFEARMLPLIQNISQILIFAISVYAFFLIWKIDVTAWLASAGIVGLALSFAAKDTLANLFAGASIIADAPYKMGDFIVLETGERGVVTHIGLRSTRLLTRDDVEITIPNAVIGTGKILNETGGPSSSHRIRVGVGVAYGSDIDQVMTVLTNVAEQNPEICKTPAARVRFRAFGESSLDFELLAWIDQPVNRGRLRHNLHCAVYKAFIDNRIEIPFPQRDVHVRQVGAEKPAES